MCVTSCTSNKQEPTLVLQDPAEVLLVSFRRIKKLKVVHLSINWTKRVVFGACYSRYAANRQL